MICSEEQSNRMKNIHLCFCPSAGENETNKMALPPETVMGHDEEEYICVTTSCLTNASVVR